MAITVANAMRILVVGGGRWAATLAGVILEATHRSTRLGLVSPRNVSGLSGWRSGRAVDAERIEVFNDLDGALNSGLWSAAIVANLPGEHAQTTRRLLRAHIPTLVEKPFAPTLVEARALVDLASECKVAVSVGHELLYLDDVAAFAALTTDADACAIEMWWHESPYRHRDGSMRVPDLSVSPVSDYLPHLLSILNAAVDLAPSVLKSVDLNDEGVVSITLSAPKAEVKFGLSRTHGPRRGLELTTKVGQFVVDLVPDPPRWSGNLEKSVGGAQQPLQRELRAFLNTVARREVPGRAFTDALLNVVRLTEDAEVLLQKARECAMRAQLRRGIDAPIVPSVLDAVREALIVNLADLKLIKSVKDFDGANRWAACAWLVIASLADDAFASAVDISRRIGATSDEYGRLSDAIAAWNPGQKLIMAGGRARKYWTNTIAPLLYNRVIAGTIENQPSYPFRIGIYPGLSCMFRCSFCGRVDGVRYERESAAPGLSQFVGLMDAAPKDDPYRFYISGGLEPLTNPHIGEMISAGAARGFKLSMYTNALMLTPMTFSRQPGLWSLDVLRVSLYGTDAESARAVTGHPNSFDQVVKNIVELLRLREERRSPIRIGINHVLLPKASSAIASLANLLTRIRKEAGTTRGLDFLTLREDYNVKSETSLSLSEREDMRRALVALIDRTSVGGDLADLTVDLGYALEPLVEGWPAQALKFASDEILRAEGYPQVSVAIDVLGDVYMYREAAFPQRQGGERYIIGRLGRDGSMLDIITNWVKSGCRIVARPGDAGFLDIFDHVVTRLFDLASKDLAAGFPVHKGPVSAWRKTSSASFQLQTIAHPTLGPELSSEELANRRA
jgi:dTDP-4-amino-4,6-dideoxy-D-glucose ammonia-lyase